MLDQLAAWATQSVSGSMPVALPVAFLAGLVSFFSPCVIPLLPGYISYATGMSAADLVAGGSRHRLGRTLMGSSLFVAGFGVVFVASASLAGLLGSRFITWQDPLTRVMGVIMIGLGLAFTGLLRFAQRDLRLSWLPRFGLLAAPLIGFVFGLGWTPCIGPTLGVVLTMAMSQATAAKGAWLAIAYTLGLGIPFIAAAIAFNKISTAARALRNRQQLIMRIGGISMIIVGLLMATGLWTNVIGALRQSISGFVTVI